MAGRTGFAAPHLHSCPLKHQSSDKGTHSKGKTHMQPVGLTFIFVTSAGAGSLSLSFPKVPLILKTDPVYRDIFRVPPPEISFPSHYNNFRRCELLPKIYTAEV